MVCECYVFKVAVTAVGLGGIIIGSIANTYGWPWGSLEERSGNVFTQGDTLLIPIAVSERGFVERLANVFGQGDALLIPTAVSERGLVERLADVFTHGTPRHDSYLVHHALD